MHEYATLMELHGENDFKIKAYNNAYVTIKKMDTPLVDLSSKALQAIPGLGKSVIEKLEEIKSKQSFDALEHYRSITPEGVRQMLRIKGLGPKKVKVFWKDMQWESPGELYYACLENRLVGLKGFGEKTQLEILKNIEYYRESLGHFLYAAIEQDANDIIESLRALNPQVRIEWTGEFCRKCPTIGSLQMICDATAIQYPAHITKLDNGRYQYKDRLTFEIITAQPDQFLLTWMHTTSGSPQFVGEFLSHSAVAHAFPHLPKARTQQEWFQAHGKTWVPPECRDLSDFRQFDAAQIVETSDIKGVIHVHSRYSDGMYSLEEMAAECIRMGYRYMVISDHSRSAFYANGLSMEKVQQQWREIDELNQTLQPFKIYKSIESDILADGSLDYPDEFLRGFDLIIASIHSNLKMDEGKAMQRLIAAVEHPATRILGHPTGRLLLSRKGYPVDHKRLIDACAANRVCIELNANPHRLDIDWRFIPYAMEKGVMIAINPDAHNLNGIQDIAYGVIAARKGGLLKNFCLNNFSIAEFDSWLKSKCTI